ncbi:MAG: fibronectin type III domain-containing protein [Lewinella sp.]|nr:fibronectin type III domain-containing protein [Lewinella sp.]
MFLIIQLQVWSKTDRYRCMWREEPSTTMVIGWDQISGQNPVLRYDVINHGKDANAYRQLTKPSAVVPSKGMNNHFVRLTHLQPNTTYYFVIQDSEGITRPMSFQTTPDNPNLRLSIVAGGDSRNHRQARIEGNQLVSKLRPHFVMFGGDMTAGDTPTEWVEWMDDWQHTIGKDGRLTPIVVTRGNHEASNKSLVDLFDVKQPDLYYALTFGGNLIRVYTLNTLIPSGGDQRFWLEKDLAASQSVSWRIAQYHHTIRPHTRSKPERDELLLNWATLFHKYKLRLVVESDAHVVKWTYPIKPSRAPGSQLGFIRDDVNGTVYVGEGCWGAPLRANNDDKSWTRNSGSFNQFKWIFVDRAGIEVRTVRIEAPAGVAELSDDNRFREPRGLQLWRPSNGEVVTLVNNQATDLVREQVAPSGPPAEVIDCTAKQYGMDVIVSWAVKNDALELNYQVQRSTDGGRQYTTIADFRGKKSGESRYNCPDLDVCKRFEAGKLRYRLLYEDEAGNEQWQEPRLDLVPPPPLAAAPPSKNGLPPITPLDPDENGKITVAYNMTSPGKVEMILLTPDLREVSRVKFDQEPVGNGRKVLDISRAPNGDYLLIVKGNAKVIERFKVIK